MSKEMNGEEEKPIIPDAISSDEKFARMSDELNKYPIMMMDSDLAKQVKYHAIVNPDNGTPSFEDPLEAVRQVEIVDFDKSGSPF